MDNYRELIAEEQGVELWDDYDDMDNCEYCQDDAFNTLIKSEKIGNLIYFIALKAGGITNQDISDCEHDNSVVFEMRNGSGYIRLGDTDDMGCIDHSGNFKINYCPMCGRKL